VSWFAYVGQNPLRYIDPTGLTLTQQFDSGIAGTTDISEREYAEYYDWALRSGLKDDIKTKAQFSDLEERLDAIHHIRSLQNVADLGGPLQRNIEAQLTAAMGEYNRRYFNDISPLDGLEGSYVTTEFGATIDEFWQASRQSYYGSIHGGTDIRAEPGTHHYAQLFLKLEYAEGNRVAYKVIGMDRYIGGTHLSDDEVVRMSDMIGEIFYPGDPTHKFPEAIESGDPIRASAPIEHIFEYNSEEMFFDPITHQLPERQPFQWRRFPPTWDPGIGPDGANGLVPVPTRVIPFLTHFDFQ
jgi:hypothetical protein